MAEFLNISGLVAGAASAVILYFWPPMTIEYTEDGSQKFGWKNKPTEVGRRAYGNRKTLSKFALALLFVSFALQLASAVMQHFEI